MESEKDEAWYMIRVYPGKEEQVKNAMLRRLDAENLQDRIRTIIAPTSGSESPAVPSRYVGWVLVKMKFDLKVWSLLRNTPGVEGYVGWGNKPTSFLGQDWGDLPLDY